MKMWSHTDSDIRGIQFETGFRTQNMFWSESHTVLH